jgi:hypothetical protein
MKSHHFTSIAITSIVYYAAYWDAKVGVLVRLADATWLIISFTLPLMLISNWADLVNYKYWVLALFLSGTLIFSALIARVDPSYNQATDGFMSVFPSALVCFWFLILAQIFLNSWVRKITKRR